MYALGTIARLGLLSAAMFASSTVAYSQEPAGEASRLAIVVGQNNGLTDEVRLHYAESDARDMCDQHSVCDRERQPWRSEHVRLRSSAKRLELLSALTS